MTVTRLVRIVTLVLLLSSLGFADSNHSSAFRRQSYRRPYYGYRSYRGYQPWWKRYWWNRNRQQFRPVQYRPNPNPPAPPSNPFPTIDPPSVTGPRPKNKIDDLAGQSIRLVCEENGVRKSGIVHISKAENTPEWKLKRSGPLEISFATEDSTDFFQRKSDGEIGDHAAERRAKGTYLGEDFYRAGDKPSPDSVKFQYGLATAHLGGPFHREDYVLAQGENGKVSVSVTREIRSKDRGPVSTSQMSCQEEGPRSATLVTDKVRTYHFTDAVPNMAFPRSAIFIKDLKSGEVGYTVPNSAYEKVLELIVSVKGKEFIIRNPFRSAQPLSTMALWGRNLAIKSLPLTMISELNQQGADVGNADEVTLVGLKAYNLL